MHGLADDAGAAMIETSLIAMLLFLVTFGVTDFAAAMWQWNQAAKAVQVGARLAAVSDPVWPTLATMTGLEGTAQPGDPMPDFSATCSGATMACTGSYAGGAGNGSADTTALTALVARMTQIFPRLTAANVVVEYRNSGLGFAGRPSGPVPTITVRLTGLTFNMPALDTLALLGPIAMPDFQTPITGEDLSSSAPP